MQDLILSIPEKLQRIPGVEAVVLGGSRARGTHIASSDIDLGIYYDPQHPLDIEALNRLAIELDDQHRPDLVTAIGGWGTWINGGGWLTVQGVPVDLLYRDANQVNQVIQDCHTGIITMDYQPGHPHGFLSAIYMAEVALCQTLWDPHDTLLQLKTQTTPYPEALKQALIRKFFWEADFALANARKAASRRDTTYVAGCCFRSISCLLQTLFALNGQYWMNEKGAVALAAQFSLAPAAFERRVQTLFAALGAEPDELARTIQELEEMVKEVQALL